jgi:hypothetical protein
MAKKKEYKLKRNAMRRMAYLQCGYPNRKFWVAPTPNFRWAVYTTRSEHLTDDPNNIGICA